MPILPGEGIGAATFDTTPYWFSGAGTARGTPDIFTNGAKAAQLAALVDIAKQYGVDPQTYFNALSYAGLDPNSMSVEQLNSYRVPDYRVPDYRAPDVDRIRLEMAALTKRMDDIYAGPVGSLEEMAYKEAEHAQLKQQLADLQLASMSQAPIRADGAPPPPPDGKSLLDRFLAVKDTPAIQERFGPYEKPPGILKQIADIAAGRLAERARMKPSDRIYKGDRLAPFDPAQVKAQAALSQIGNQSALNNPIHQGVLGRLQALQTENPLKVANSFLARGTSDVTPEERALFRESAMRDVVTPLHEKMRRDLQEKILPQIQTSRVMKGNLYGGGTDKLRERALENFNRDAMEVALPHLFDAENRGQAAGERRRQAQINAGQISAPAGIQAMGAQREAALSTSEAMRNKQMQDLVAAEASQSAGAARQAQKQQAMNIAAQNWDAENRGLLDEAAEVGAIVRGQQIPRFATSTSPVNPSPSLSSTLGQLAVGGGFMNMMGQPNAPKTAKAGGRIKLSAGGVAQNMLADKLANYRGSLFERIMNAGNPNPSMASQQVQQDMLNQAPPPPSGGVFGAMPSPEMSSPPAPEEVPAGPLERGGQSAMSALDKMNQYRSELAQRSASLDSGAHDTNPLLPFLAKTFIGAAGSKSLNLSDRLGEGAQGGYQAFEQQRAINARNRELSDNIKKALIETHQKEQAHEMELQIRRDEIARKAKLDEAELKLKGISTGSSADANKAHAEYYRAMAHKTLHPEEQPQKGQNYTVPVIGSAETGSEKSQSEQQKVMLTPMTNERKKRLEDLQKGYKANKEVKALSSGMLDDIESVGYQGAGGDSLAPEIATLLSGKSDVHGKFEKDSAALQLARKDSMQGRVTNASLKLIEQSKPRHGVNKGTNKLVLAETLGNSIQKDIVMPFEIKCIESNIPDSVIDDAVAKWEKANPVAIKGKPVMPKGTPADYLPKEYKMYLKLDGSEKSGGALSDMSDEELLRIANGG